MAVAQVAAGSAKGITTGLWYFIRSHDMAVIDLVAKLALVAEPGVRPDRKLLRLSGKSPRFWPGLWACGALALVACTSPAEHRNPLDPQSPAYTLNGTIAGQITSYYQPYQPVPGARVELQPPGLALASAADGSFGFGGLPPDTYALAVTAPGYASATDTLALLPRQRQVRDFHLDGLPAAQSLRAFSAHVTTRESPGERFFLEVHAEIVDPDGANDVRSVVLDIPVFGVRDTLARGSGQTRWQRTFTETGLNSFALYDLVGQPLYLVLEDFPGERTTAGPFQLVRVIAETPQPVSPVDGALVTETAPTFRWLAVGVPFTHALRVEVYRLDAGFPVFVTAIGNIAAGNTSVKYPGRLTAGTYYWTLQVSDEFGNSSRSHEATFLVP